jgi:hypothetical protein
VQRGTRLSWRRKSTFRVAGRAAGAALLALAAVGCRETPAAFGPTPESARLHASELFESIALTFTQVNRTAVAAAARLKLGRAVLVPSRVYKDSTVWTTILPDSTRDLSISGRVVGDHYLLSERIDPPRPEQLGDQRRGIWLTRLSSNDYEWRTSVETAIGSLTVDDVDHVIASMLSAAASNSGDALRLGSEAAFPRATAALGRLFSFDSARATPAGEGSADVALFFSLHLDRLKQVYPAFATYIAHYGGPSRLHFALTDAQGAGWFDFDFADERITVHFRATREGQLAPATGPTRPMPDSLLLRTDFHTKVWLLAIGIIDLESGLTVIHSEHSLGWHLTYRKEPKWHLPLAFLVSGSLRHPFMGDGAEVNIFFRDTVGAATLFVRGGRVAVQESTTMRWFGGLGMRAQGDFVGATEAETYAFVAQALNALRADIGDQTAAASTGEVDSTSRAATHP